jgi:hypothetical protein
MEYYLLPKNQGGLGIKVLELKNKCSLGKWLFILLSKAFHNASFLARYYMQSAYVAPY